MMSIRRLATLLVASAGLAAGLTAVGSAPAGAGPAPAPAAATCVNEGTGGSVTKSIWVGLTLRSFNLHIPEGTSGDVPVLISLHGLGSNAFFQQTATRWSDYADEKGFIVAYPAGSSWGQAWNVNDGSQDSKFVAKVASWIDANHCVDSSRIFVEGGSLGGMMAQRALCDSEHIFAAGISTISSGYDYFGGGCRLDRPVSIGIVQGEADPLFPVSTGLATRDKWRTLDGCSGEPTSVPNDYGSHGEVWSCKSGSQVMFRSYAGLDHAYPTGDALTDFHDTTWEFLNAHPLR